MKDTMEAEYKEMIRTLERANSALARIFNVEEGEVSCGACGQLTSDLESHLPECDLNPTNEEESE